MSDVNTFQATQKNLDILNLNLIKATWTFKKGLMIFQDWYNWQGLMIFQDIWRV